MITKTLGTSGADFTSINSWVSWVQANAVSGGNLTDSVTLDTLTVGVSASATDTVSGWAPGGSAFTTTLTSSSGHSANSNANVQSNAFYFTTANGSFIDHSGGGGITISVDKAEVSYQQIKGTSSVLYWTTSSGTGTIVSNIVQGTGGGAQIVRATSGVNITATNNLFVSTSSGSYGVRLTNGTCADNTIVGLSGSYGISLFNWKYCYHWECFCWRDERSCCCLSDRFQQCNNECCLFWLMPNDSGTDQPRRRDGVSGII